MYLLVSVDNFIMNYYVQARGLERLGNINVESWNYINSGKQQNEASSCIWKGNVEEKILKVIDVRMVFHSYYFLLSTLPPDN